MTLAMAIFSFLPQLQCAISSIRATVEIISKLFKNIVMDYVIAYNCWKPNVIAAGKKCCKQETKAEQ